MGCLRYPLVDKPLRALGPGMDGVCLQRALVICRNILLPFRLSLFAGNSLSADCILATGPLAILLGILNAALHLGISIHFFSLDALCVQFQKKETARTRGGVVPFSHAYTHTRFALDTKKRFCILDLLLNGSAYPEWLRGQARRSHSNLVREPRC